MCYFCERVANEAEEIMAHELRHHTADQTMFSVRLKTIDDQNGTVLYRSQHYGILLKDLGEKIVWCKANH